MFEFKAFELTQPLGWNVKRLQEQRKRSPVVLIQNFEKLYITYVPNLTDWNKILEILFLAPAGSSYWLLLYIALFFWSLLRVVTQGFKLDQLPNDCSTFQLNFLYPHSWVKYLNSPTWGINSLPTWSKQSIFFWPEKPVLCVTLTGSRNCNHTISD